LAPETTSKVLLQDVKTRWNSTIIMTMRLIELRDPLTIFCGRSSAVRMMTPDRWEVLAGLCCLMTPFDNVTKDVCRASSSASLHIPTAKLLKASIKKLPDNRVGTLKEDLLADIEARWAKKEEVMPLAVAAFLDPRFKEKSFDNKDKTLDAVKKRLIADHQTEPADEDCMQPNEAGPSRQSQSEEPAEPPAKKPRTESTQQLSSMWADVFGSKEDAPGPSGVAAEIEAFSGETIAPFNSDPLQWWKLKSDRYPLLSMSARRYLGAPATSVDSERMFSVSGNIFNEKRTRLSPTHLEQLVFLNINLRIMHGKF
jgi:hypothetical protein